jgi:hypothetical protein
MAKRACPDYRCWVTRASKPGHLDEVDRSGGSATGPAPLDRFSCPEGCRIDRFGQVAKVIHSKAGHRSTQKRRHPPSKGKPFVEELGVRAKPTPAARAADARCRDGQESPAGRRRGLSFRRHDLQRGARCSRQQLFGHALPLTGCAAIQRSEPG